MSKAERVVEFAHLFQILRQATDMGSLCPLVLATSLYKGRCACQIWQWRREPGGAQHRVLVLPVPAGTSSGSTASSCSFVSVDNSLDCLRADQPL